MAAHKIDICGAKIIIARTFFPEDLKYIKRASLLDSFSSSNAPERGTWMINACKGADLVIFYMAGVNNPSMLERLSYLVDKINIPKAYWGQDPPSISKCFIPTSVQREQSVGHL